MIALAKRRILELWGLGLALAVISWSMSQTQHLTTAAAASSSDSYLYNTIDSSPIIDHGLSGDYTKSNSPKVVEFYNHKCGACQAFKYNYIELAKKVQSSRPDVEFYGVSCALHQSLCEGARVPKIVVFPAGDSEGVQVEKGSGAIYFLSQRLLKALRSPDEIAADADSARLGSRNVRRLRANAGEDDAADDMHPDEGDVMYLDEEDEDVEEVNHEMVESEIPEAEPDENADESPSADNRKDDIDETTGTKWDYNKLVEIKDVPREQWKPIHETDAWKNTMNELQNKDSQLGAQFLQWKHEHDAKLRAQAEQADKEEDRLVSKIDGDVERESSKEQGKQKADTKPREDEEQSNEEKDRLVSKIDGDVIRESARVQERQKAHIKSNLEEEEKAPPPPPKTKQIEITQDEVDPPRVFPSNLSPEQEKKFKEFIEKKRKAAIRHEQLKHPVKALLGAGDAKTVQQKEKHQSPMNNYKSQYKASQQTQKDQKPKADLRPEAQQKTTKEKILSKVPIVKRAFNKHSQAQDTLNDAALSFTRSLLMGVFKGNTKGSLDYKRKKALKDWFDLMSVSLPPEMNLHELIDTLNANIDEITSSEVKLKSILESHFIPDSNWSKSCTAEAGSLGFFCGFWKLLHIMSLGVAEQAGGLMLREAIPSVRVFSTQEAASVLREYMIYFFNCDKCVKRFVGQYDSCGLQRCNRLSEQTEFVSVDTWRQFPLWMWEVHNDVSRSKANRAVEIFESRGRKAEARMFERDMRAVYPHIDQCVTCFDHEGKWNIDAVYNYLEREYWDFGHSVSPTVENMLDYSTGKREKSFGFGKMLFLSAVIGAITWLVKKKKLQFSGRHKKHEIEFGSFPSGRGSIKYRDS